MKKPIELKGSGGGLVLQATENLDSDLFLEELRRMLDEGGSFFAGGKVVGLTGVDYTYAEKAAIESVLEDYQLKVVSLEHPTRQAAVKAPQASTDVATATPPMKEEPGCAEKTKLVRGTLRSGSRLDHHGDVVIFGDVNPGAEVYAEGNVIVLGKLRGVAHAGAAGDVSAFIVAMDFRPTQLRIATIITRPPEETADRERYPEIAYIDESGQIVLEAVD